jgi:hypothetical protein
MEQEGFEAYMATGRQKHHPGQPATPLPVPLPEEATAKERMQVKLSTPEGQKLYAQRKTIVVPVFGQIKGASVFRRFSFRGLL